MGAEVTIVEMLDRILPVEDAEVSDFMAKALAKQKMTILTGAGVVKLTPSAKGVSAGIKTSDGKSASHDFGHASVAVGILPHTENTGQAPRGRESGEARGGEDVYN